MAQVIITTQAELESIIEISIQRAFKDQQRKVPEIETDKLLTISEASHYLNLAQQTLYGFTSKNLIPFIKKGKKLYFQKSSLDSWLLTGKQKTILEIKEELEGGKK